ncbi:MAG: spermine synthase [Gammaproteobacteria bacterium]|jgi:spermidine synthase|nr:spermine synthase [Gammaproteobacteria bacterium]
MSRRFLYLLYACSGASSLAFEVLWARMLSLQFGVSIFGVVVTIAAFMAGLGLGSLFGLRLARQSRRPLITFACLEGGIAIYALALPWLLSHAESFLMQLAAGAPLQTWYLLQSTALLVLILLPAVAMGAGFPLVLKALGARPHVLGTLYGLNAFGAALGALLPLWLLPRFGWMAAVEAVAMLGLLVGASAGALAWRGEFRAVPEPVAKPVDRQSPSMTALLAYAVIGGAAIMLEVAWTRLYGMILLRTEYVMAVILAVYLLGIGGGSLLARCLRDTRWLAMFPLAAAVLSLPGLWLLPAISAWSQSQEFGSLWTALVAEGLMLALVTLPVTLLLGAWLPLLARHYGDEGSFGPLFYGVNSVGSAAGGLLAGFVLIPLAGTPATLVLAALALFIAGCAWSPSRRVWLAFPLLLVAFWPVADFPPVAKLMPGMQAGSNDLYRYEDAMAITHVVEQADGQRLLLSDLQRMDASSEQAAVEVQKNQARLPLMLHPQPESVMFLGLGTGISAAGTLDFPELQKRAAVELSLGAIRAARDWFAPVNDGIVEQMTVVRDDARRHLMANEARWDVIIGDVFHPDLVGRSALLSVQQFERTRSRLAPGGIFAQWLALNQFDPESLRVVLRSFVRVFPDGVMFMDGFRIAMVGGMGGRDPVQWLNSLRVHEAAAGTGEGLWTWLGRYWGRIPADDGGPVQDEWRPHIEFRLPQARYGSGLGFDQLLDWLLRVRPESSRAAAELGVTPADRERFEASYGASDLALKAWLAGLRGDVTQSRRLLRFAWESNPEDRWTGFSLADNILAELQESPRGLEDRRLVLEAVLSIRPDHADTLRALWHLDTAMGRHESAAAWFVRLAEVSPLDREVTTAQAGAGATETLPPK